MKPFIVSLYALFLFAMASGVAVAYRNAEGLMDTDYYEKGSSWFETKQQEQQLGFAVEKPEAISVGGNELTFRLRESAGPLGNAAVKLFIGNVSTKAHDFSVPMQEVSPGVYRAHAVLPSTGKWLVRIDLASTQLKTSRSWFYDVR
jgi:nitrogen fixation protein FixH